MKKDTAKPVDLSAGILPVLNADILDVIVGGQALEYLTEEEATEIVRRNVEWNLQNGCATDAESQKRMVKIWMAKPINRAELENLGGIAYFFPK